MKSELIIIFVILLIFSCVVLGILTYVPDHQLRQSFRDIFTTFEVTTKTVLVLFGIGIGLVVIIGLVWLTSIAYASGIVWYSMARSRQAEALKVEREASLVVTVAPPGSQVYASEVVGKLTLAHKPLYLAPGIVSHKPGAPTLDQIKRWSFFQLTHNISKKPQIATEEISQLQQPLPEHVDLSQYVTGLTSLHRIFLGVGRLPNGQVRSVSAPLGRLVHIAVAGSSGFGKSTLMQALGYQVINAREQPSVVMLDAQGVTFTPFEDNKNLRYPLVSEGEDIRTILHDLLTEMKRRKELYSRWRGIDNLDKYNQAVDEQQHLPVIPIFFDEFGLLANDKDVANYVKKLLQAGRKFGMYFIAGSQTWYSDEIASSLKANLSTSIQFYAKSKSQSRVLLGDSAASDITRPGHAFCRLPGQPGLIELQAPDATTVLDITPRLITGKTARNPVMPQLQPTDLEQMILNLFDEQAQQGQMNKAAISIAVFGSKGGNQYKKINDVLKKFGRV